MFEEINSYKKCEYCNEISAKEKCGFYICSDCGNYYTKSNGKLPISIYDIYKNKLIHLNNVLKRMENIDNSVINPLYDKLIQNIKETNLSPNFIDATYIYEFLKKEGKKNYIVDMVILNKYNKNKFRLSGYNKMSIRIVFLDFIKFDYSSKYFKDSNSISYHYVLNVFFKYLDINTYLEPSLTRNANNDLKFSLEKYLNFLCQNKKRKKDLHFLDINPPIDKFKINNFSMFL